MSHGYYKNKTVTTYSDQNIGFDQISIQRPQFIYFEFEGLRPNIPHYFFFGGRNVTTYVKTGVAKTTFTNAGRNSKLKEPGDSYINETAYPTAQGGPTSSSGDGIKTDNTGKIYGLFYLQSNNTLNWPANYDGTEFVVTDVATAIKENSTSYGVTKFSAFGQIQNYWVKATTSTTSTWVAYTHSPPPSSSNNDNNYSAPLLSVKVGNKWHNAYTPSQVASVSKKAAAGGTITSNNTGMSNTNVNNIGAVQNGTYDRSMGGF